MTRPEIVRADSIDLNDRETPSAKEHPRVKSNTLASHQKETLREVAAETAKDRRVSWNGGDMSDLQPYAKDLAASVANSMSVQVNVQNGDLHHNMHGNGQDAVTVAQSDGQDMENGNTDDDDDDIDDDMMDKISSSPSIEDGGCDYSLPVWFRGRDSSGSSASPRSALASPLKMGEKLSSPYLDCPGVKPSAYSEATEQLPPDKELPVDPSGDFSRHHHLQGKYYEQDPTMSSSSEQPTPTDDDDADDADYQTGERSLEDVYEKRGDPMEGNKVSAGVVEQVLGDWLDSPELSAGAKHEDVEANPPENTSTVEQRLDAITLDLEAYELSELLKRPFEVNLDDGGDFDDDFSEFPIEDKFVDFGWGDECLHNDIEDIDFELVYALHTFVATVEGQANATKGDAMVLLDDSNSYWWLVRVVKDSSIGYLPAEHIETPTERLARLNKHRNIDLSATMLGDQAEKPKGSIKSAIKKRKAKTVQFAGNTYVDYSDIEYSTDDEDAEGEYYANTQQEGQQEGQQEQQAQAQQARAQQVSVESELEDDTAKVEPLKPKSRDRAASVGAVDENVEDTDGIETTGNRLRTSEDVYEMKSGDGPKKSSDGTVRDSFFKDETVETKKITLTPNLLRDDNAPQTSNETKESKQRPSLDKLEKDSGLTKDEKRKKDKKEKDKKPSAIRSFFSRKDKKSKGDDEEDSLGKRSLDSSEQHDKDKDDDEVALQQSPERSPLQRSSSKLQKVLPRTEPSPIKRQGERREDNQSDTQTELDLLTFLSEGKVNNITTMPPASMRVVDPEEGANVQVKGPPPQQPRPSTRDRSPGITRRDQQTAIPQTGKSRSPSRQPKTLKVNKPTSHVETDASGPFDKDANKQVSAEPTRQVPAAVEERPGQEQQVQQQASLQAPQQAQQQRQQPKRPTIPGTFPESHQSTPVQNEAPAPRPAPQTTPPQKHAERLFESPVQVSPVHSSNMPPLVVDTSSQEEDQSSQRSSPELIEHEETGRIRKQTSIERAESTSRASSTAWSDASLWAFFDSGSNVRDFLAVVYDKSDVEPAGPEHPLTGMLFKEQNAKLAEITTQLDNMLGDWLARKQRLRGTV